jgi:hypothetical protein
VLALTFAWPGRTTSRRWDVEPNLAASRFPEVLLTDYERFAELHGDKRILS